MKLHHFRDVAAIAEYGSLRAAARRLGLAQPALTRSLGELEREMGCALFERQPRGMWPTAAGLAFVRRAEIVLNEVRRARDEVDQIARCAGGRVVVGLSIAPHIALLPRTLAPFRARYASVQLDIIEGFYPTLEAGLRNGDVDFYIGPKPDVEISGELMQAHLFANTRVALCRKGHPLSDATSLSQLVDAEWATTSITARAEEEFRRLFENHDLPAPRLVLRSQSALTLMVAISNTDLLAMAPIQWTQFAPTADLLTRIPLAEWVAAPDIVVIRRGGAPLTPAATYLLDLMENAVSS